MWIYTYAKCAAFDSIHTLRILMWLIYFLLVSRMSPTTTARINFISKKKHWRCWYNNQMVRDGCLPPLNNNNNNAEVGNGLAHLQQRSLDICHHQYSILIFAHKRCECAICYLLRNDQMWLKKIAWKYDENMHLIIVNASWIKLHIYNIMQRAR